MLWFSRQRATPTLMTHSCIVFSDSQAAADSKECTKPLLHWSTCVWSPLASSHRIKHKQLDSFDSSGNVLLDILKSNHRSTGLVEREYVCSFGARITGSCLRQQTPTHWPIAVIREQPHHEMSWAERSMGFLYLLLFNCCMFPQRKGPHTYWLLLTQQSA